MSNFTSMDESNSQHLSALYLKQVNPINETGVDDESTSDEAKLVCLVCEDVFSAGRETSEGDDGRALSQLEKHLLIKHHLIISDIRKIDNLARYCEHWKKKIRECGGLSEICAIINTNTGPDDEHPSEEYYLLGGDENIFEEDSQLRLQLKNEKISAILRQSQNERDDDSFSSRCLFCRKVFTGNRAILFDHITADHNFSIGHPDNIVHCAQLLQLLEEKLAKLTCLYCERIFKSWSVLKEHMRKKGHKLLNPNNREYDKFYLINYLNPGKHWQVLKEEKDEKCVVGEKEGEEEDDNWDDWVEESGTDCSCLFCECNLTFDKLKDHLLKVHGFHFDATLNQLEFYSRIKCINYMRRCIHQNKCHICKASFPSNDTLLVHLEFSNHSTSIPSKEEYDLPEYFFSTYENDNLLHFLGNEDDD